jgi:hypothetical protein
MTNPNVNFVIESGVALPPRTIPNAGPRESQYPVDKLTQGQAFAIPLGTYDEAGNFTAFAAGSDEALKQSRQKQSQMSSLARTRNISLVTRYYSGVGESQSPFSNVPAPCLGVWHDGPAKEKKPRKSKKADGNADAGNAGEASAAGTSQADDGTMTL